MEPAADGLPAENTASSSSSSSAAAAATTARVIWHYAASLQTDILGEGKVVGR